MALTEQDQGLPNNPSAKVKSLLDYSLTRRGLFKVSAASVALAALSACRIDVSPRVSMTPERKFKEIWSRPVGFSDRLALDQSGIFLGSGTPEVIKIGLGDGQILARGLINGGNILESRDRNLYVSNFDKSIDRTITIAAIDTDTLQLRWTGQPTSALSVANPSRYLYKNKLAVNYAGTTVYDSDSGKVLAELSRRLFHRSNASWTPDFMQLDENNKWLVAPTIKDNMLPVLVEKLSPNLPIPPSSYLQPTLSQDQLFNLETLAFETDMPKYLFFNDMEVFGVRGRSVLYNLRTRIGPDGVAAVDLDSKEQKWLQKEGQLIQLSDTVAITRLDIDDASALLRGFDIESGRQLWEEKVMPDLGLTRVGDQFYGIQTVITKEAKGAGAEGVWYLNLLKLDHQTGKTNWSTLVDGGLTSGLSLRGEVERIPAKRRLCWLDNQYFVVSNEKNAYLLSSESGKVLGQAEFLAPMQMSFYRKHVSISEAINSGLVTSNEDEIFMGIGSHLFVVDKSQGNMRLERYYGNDDPTPGTISIVSAIGRQLFVKVGRLIHCYQTS